MWTTDTSIQGVPTASPQDMGVVWLEVLGSGHGFTISELFFCLSAGLDKSGCVSLYQMTERWLAKCLWVKDLPLGTEASRNRSGERALPTDCRLHVKYYGAEMKLLSFLGKP